jgi:phosphopantothenoylcysteine decarboxylase/phosphopantothenate--cysteine ligase
VHRTNIESAQNMLDAVIAILPETDIFIGAAAVADYRPADVSDQKIKKNQDDMHIHLVKNPDIIASVAAQANPPFCVGFAAETQDVVTYARGKLEKKKLNMVVANDVSSQHIGFNSDDNAIIIIDQDTSTEYGQASKYVLSQKIIEHIAAKLPKDI